MALCKITEMFWKQNITEYKAPMQTEIFGYKYELYRTKQTFIVELGFLGVHSDEDHQR